MAQKRNKNPVEEEERDRAKKSFIFGFLILNNNRVPGPLKLVVLLRNLEFLLKLQVWYNLHTNNLFLFVKF